ncbi:malto-oligosyltrehalose trehalohydrolase [uncultured Sphingomonas sp.]|uniref:malto-oligosyltrehalose trehalohydrolase n=1 Tax=uncultured Sphingomonas sp. TaxID=158754 RepID=UPI0035CC8A2E
MRWGASIIAAGRTRFALWAPDRAAVTLVIDGREPLPMTAQDDGWFAIETDAPAGTRYLFRVAEAVDVPDPASRAQSGGVHGWSVVVDPTTFRWRSDWRGRLWSEHVIQEIHVGVLGGFRGVIAQLPAIADLGVTAIELMPVAAFGGERGWGYDGVLPYAPAEAYGTPDDLRALVDAAHGVGLSVLLDVVYNHFGPDGNYLGGYASGFFHTDVATPWGGAVAVDQPAVARYFIDNALMWLEDYRVDGLRFDAVHAIGDDAFLDTMAEEIRARCGDRPVHLVLENEHNDADRIGGGRYDAQWNDDFHNVLHVLLTGETSAYYGDFAERPAERLARCLGEGFIYQGEASPNGGGAARGKPSGHLPPTAFVSFLQNHDQIGNRALGERLTILADQAKLRAATALLLLCPQIPLIFMGDESGSDTPFLFFTDFHDELADAVREGRRREFAKFAAFADEAARAAIPDPNARSTFGASRPQPGPAAAEWRELYRRLLAARRTEIVPRLAGARALGAQVVGDKAFVARWAMGDDRVLTLLFNIGDDAVELPEQSAPFFAVGEPGGSASLAAWLV